MLLRLFLYTCALALLLFSCQDGSKEAPETASYADVTLEPPRTAEPPPPPSAPEQAPARANQKIVYTAEARARVAQLDTALARVVAAAERAGGFVASQHRENSGYRRSARLTLRLPAERLQPTLALLPAIAEQIDYENLESRNVTAEWLDLESRLNTKRAVRDRYVDILRNRARKVEDILAAEDKIRVITEEIEAREGRLRYLRDQVSLSTFELELYQTIEYRAAGQPVTRSFWNRLGESFTDSLAIIEGLFLGVVTLWPVLLLVGLLSWFIWRRWLRR